MAKILFKGIVFIFRRCEISSYQHRVPYTRLGVPKVTGEGAKKEKKRKHTDRDEGINN